MKTENNSKVFHIKNTTSTIPFIIAFTVLHRTSPYFTVLHHTVHMSCDLLDIGTPGYAIDSWRVFIRREGGGNKSSLPARKSRRKDEVLTEPRAQASGAVEREGKDT